MADQQEDAYVRLRRTSWRIRIIASLVVLAACLSYLLWLRANPDRNIRIPAPATSSTSHPAPAVTVTRTVEVTAGSQPS